MAWTTSLVQQLRYYYDVTDTTTYTDDQLSRFIGFAASEILPRLFPNTYTIDITVPSISPDPTDNPDIAALLVLKAAQIIIRQEMKPLIITAGYAIKDDRVAINGAEALKAMKDLYKAYSDNYEKAEMAYMLGNGNIGRAILAPYVPGSGPF